MVNSPPKPNKHKTVEDNRKDCALYTTIRGTLRNKTCLRGLHYTEKSTVSPDSVSKNKIKEVKLEAEPCPVDALTCYQKYRLKVQFAETSM